MFRASAWSSAELTDPPASPSPSAHGRCRSRLRQPDTNVLIMIRHSHARRSASDRSCDAALSARTRVS